MSFDTIRDIIEFLRVYCPWHVSEHAQIGCGKIIYGKEEIATFEPEKNSNVPIFTFIEEYSFCNENQKIDRWKALERIFGYPRFPSVLNTESLWHKHYFIGNLKQRKPFTRSDEAFDVYFDMDGGNIIAVSEDGSQRKHPFFAIREKESLNIETDVSQRAWAVVYTEHKPFDFKRPMPAKPSDKESMAVQA